MASRRVERWPFALLLVVAVAAVAGFLGASPASLAAGSGERPHPQPQKLWNAYPLDAKGIHAPRGRVTSPSPTPRESRGGSSSLLLLWISLAAFGASLVGFAVAWRESPRLRSTRRALIFAGDNVRAFGRDLAAGMLRLRSSSSGRLAMIARRPSAGRAAPGQLAQVLSAVLHELTPPRPQNAEVRLHALPSPQEEPEASDTARERAVLKQKRAAATSAEVRKLKEKTRAVARDTQRIDEIAMLKAKLADSVETSSGGAFAARGLQKGER